LNSFQYIDLSDKTIKNIVNYGNELNQYNIDYINNKTKNIKESTKNMIKDISISNINQLNLSFDDLYNTLIQMDLCLGYGILIIILIFYSNYSITLVILIIYTNYIY
jgi:hypothetical protein